MKNIEHYISGSKRLWNNSLFRKSAYAAFLFTLSMASIYLFKSDNIDTEIKTHNRVTPSAKTDNSGGLSINGLSIDYIANTNTLYSIDDFVGNQKSTNIEFTRSPEHPAISIYIEFDRNGRKFVQELSFDGNPLISETKELSYSKGKLESITVKEKEFNYKVGFR